MASCSSSPAKRLKGESTTRDPNWLELPRDVTANILHRLDILERVRSARRVCSEWRNIFKDPLMWHSIDMSFHYSLWGDYLVDICRYAVGQSDGHVENIDIDVFATDDLLKYIANSASHLRCMRLGNCHKISDKGLSEFIKKAPLLEELDVSFCYYISKDSLDVIGQYCPLLKSLKFCHFHDVFFEEDGVALAIIGRTMPGLRCLKISGTTPGNVGLRAILDGCPFLESLDLQQCYCIQLDGSLEKRCHQQIKDLRLPDDPVWPF